MSIENKLNKQLENKLILIISKRKNQLDQTKKLDNLNYIFKIIKYFQIYFIQ